jgi:hypothetical protein
MGEKKWSDGVIEKTAILIIFLFPTLQILQYSIAVYQVFSTP